MSIFWAIVAIGLLIVVHEAGHFVVARLCKMRVEKFSLGFGPALLKWKRRPDSTQFQLAPIPFGGFVEIKGMNIVEEVDPNDPTAYPNRPVWQRFLTIFAGPATNYLFAIVLAFTLFHCAGIKTRVGPSEWQVSKTEEGMPAHGKVEACDKFLAIDGQPLTRAFTDHIADLGGRAAVFTIDRKGEKLDITMQPAQDAEGRWRLGVHIAELVKFERRTVGLGDALGEALVYPVNATKEMTANVVDMVTGKAKGEVSSVVGITQHVSNTIDVGWAETIALLMMLNVWLGLFNLLPFPALDGGRLVFLAYEMVTRRRANPKLEATVHMVGVLVLIVLIVVVTVNDCRRWDQRSAPPPTETHACER